MSSTTPGDEKKQSDPLVLKIHILTYLEEELVWRHWERLLRANSTLAIFTVIIIKKVLIKMFPRCMPLVALAFCVLHLTKLKTNNSINEIIHLFL